MQDFNFFLNFFFFYIIMEKKKIYFEFGPAEKKQASLPMEKSTYLMSLN